MYRSRQYVHLAVHQTRVVIMKDSTDVVVHINENLDQENRRALTKKISELEGVISADLAAKRPHLMIVGYDPEKTKSLEVLTGVNDAGVHAQLIGWL